MKAWICAWNNKCTTCSNRGLGRSMGKCPFDLRLKLLILCCSMTSIPTYCTSRPGPKLPATPCSLLESCRPNTLLCNDHVVSRQQQFAKTDHMNTCSMDTHAHQQQKLLKAFAPLPEAAAQPPQRRWGAWAPQRSCLPCRAGLFGLSRTRSEPRPWAPPPLALAPPAAQSSEQLQRESPCLKLFVQICALLIVLRSCPAHGALPDRLPDMHAHGGR